MNISFKQYNNSELNNRVKDLAQNERRLTALILAHISEVDRRKLFLDMAYPSLFEYLTKEIGYSAGGAQRRIDASRLSQVIPEVSLKIESGALNLNQISKLQQVCREVKKTTGEKVSTIQKRSALHKIENENQQRTESILAQEFGITPKQSERKRQQADESVRVEITFDREEMELINKAQALLSNTSGGTLKEALLAMAKVTVAKFQQKKESFKEDIKSVTPALKKAVISRDQSCQFIDSQSGKKCDSRYYLEIDHIQPKFAHGGNQLHNLRVLCRNHNQNRYKAQTNVRAVGKS